MSSNTTPDCCITFMWLVWDNANTFSLEFSLLYAEYRRACAVVSVSSGPAAQLGRFIPVLDLTHLFTSQGCGPSITRAASATSHYTGILIMEYLDLHESILPLRSIARNVENVSLPESCNDGREIPLYKKPEPLINTSLIKKHSIVWNISYCT